MTTDHNPHLTERLCVTMHNAYETAAQNEGWATNLDSRVPWSQVPEPNRATMRAAVTEALRYLSNDIRMHATNRFDNHGLTDARGAAFWDIANYLTEPQEILNAQYATLDRDRPTRDA